MSWVVASVFLFLENILMPNNPNLSLKSLIQKQKCEIQDIIFQIWSNAKKLKFKNTYFLVHAP